MHSCRDLSVSCACERLPLPQVWCRRETCLRSVADHSSCVVGAHSPVLRICCGTASPRKGTTRRARMHPQHPPPSACSHSTTPSYFDIFWCLGRGWEIIVSAAHLKCVWSPPGHVYVRWRTLCLIDCSARISVVWVMLPWTGLWKRSCGPRAPSFPCRAAPPTWWSTTLTSIWVRGRDRRAQYMTATSYLVGIVVTRLLRTACCLHEQTISMMPHSWP